MRLLGAGLAAGIGLLAWGGVALAQAPAAKASTVSFSKDIVPILKAECAKCHNTRQDTGGFSVTTFKEIQKGGKRGNVLGTKAEDSLLYKLLIGAAQPKMPPGGSLKKDDLAKVKTWLDQGGKTDVPVDQILIGETAIPKVDVPKIAVKAPVLPQVAALAWSPDGKVLAAGTYKTVRLIDPATGSVTRELAGHADVVNAVQFSRSGKLLAAAGGPIAQQGEIKIWDVATGKLVRTISGHSDCVYSVSWGAEDKTLASGSYDKLIKIWDVATGSEVKTLKDHADAVYAVAYNPDGNLLASGSADRSVKMWDVSTGKRIYTLGNHTDVVFSIAWNKAGDQLTSAGADKTVRTWSVNPQQGRQARSVNAHEKTVQEVLYSPDGSLVASVSDDRSIKIWNAGNGSTKRHIKDQPEGLLSAAFSPDNKLVAVGAFDGTVRIYNVEDGKLVSTPIDLPKAPEPKPAATRAEAAPAKSAVKK